MKKYKQQYNMYKTCNKHTKQMTKTSKHVKNNMLYTQMQKKTNKKCQNIYKQ